MADYQALADVEAAVREVLKYDEVESETQEKSHILWKRWGKGKADEINSRNAFIILNVDSAATIKYDSTEFADFARPSNQVQLKTSIPTKYVTKAFSWSAAVQRQQGTGTVIIDPIMKGMNDIEEMFDKQMDWHCHTSDGTGELARVSSVSGTTVTCSNSGNLFGSQRIFKNAWVEFRRSGTQLVGGGVTASQVTGVDLAAKTFTVDQIPSDPVANGDIVYDAESYNNNIRGLPYHVAASGAWQGVSDRTAYRGLSSVVQSASSASLSRALLDLVEGEVKYHIGDDAKAGERIAYTSPAQIVAFKNLMYDLKRYEGNSKSGNTGFSDTGLLHGDLPFVEAVNMWKDRVYIGDVFGCVKRFETIRPRWMREPGSQNYFMMANAASGQGRAGGFFAYYEWEGNFGMFAPRKIGVLTTLATTSLPLGNTN